MAVSEIDYNDLCDIVLNGILVQKDLLAKMIRRCEEMEKAIKTLREKNGRSEVDLDKSKQEERRVE